MEHDRVVDAWSSPRERYEKTLATDVPIGTFLRWRLGQLNDGDDRRVLLPAPPSMDVRAIIHKTPKHMSPSLAELFGLMVADGTVHPRGFRLGKRHADVTARFDELIREHFGYAPNRSEWSSMYVADVSSTMLARWFTTIGGFSPNAKYVPLSIHAASIASQKAFLRGLFEDGTVNIKNGNIKNGMVDHVELATTVESIARDVQAMLLGLGIISARPFYHPSENARLIGSHGAWRVMVYGHNAQLFRDAVGFVSEFKNKRLSDFSFPEERRYSFPVARTRIPFARKWPRSTGRLSREMARELGGFDEELSYHHERIARVEVVQREGSAP